MFDQNIFARAEQGILNFCSNANKNNPTGSIVLYDIQFLMGILDRMRNACHFEIPDNGKLIDDSFRGIEKQTIRLPYPEITIGYTQSKYKESKEFESVFAPIRLVYAVEIDKGKIVDYIASIMNIDKQIIPIDIDTLNEDGILIYSFYLSGDSNQWIPVAMGRIIRRRWDDTTGAIIIPKKEGQSAGIAGVFQPLLPSVCKAAYKTLGKKKAETIFNIDIYPECHAVLELCEALTCSNVGMRSIQGVAKEKTNLKRIQEGKLPVYETKTLTIIAPTNRISPVDSCGTSSHKSPRMHLRRGHIRRLSENHRIWINSCVVGDPADGTIHKDYRVVHGEPIP